MSTIVKKCLNCNIDFRIPKCRDWREKCCSSICKNEYREKIKFQTKKSRERCCVLCGEIFYPRKNQIENGDGKYCSRNCQIKAMIIAAHTPEANKKRVKSFMAAMKGKYKKGENHPQWTGGLKASIERTNKKRAENKEYYRQKRKQFLLKNPDKVREWAASRNRRKFGKLPRGTVKSLLELQKGCCAVCKINLNNSFHVDHVIPLSKGGLHQKQNIQILCKSCNLRKSAKDPISFMQSRGYLL